MKMIKKIAQIMVGLSLIIWMAGCNEDVTDFGFDGAISGTLKDQAGNIVAGDITANVIVIKALGEGDAVAMDIRVKGDGTYQNTKLFPKPTKFWVTGPVTMTQDTLRVDLSKNNIVQHDFVVVPFLAIKPPVVSGTPTSSTISVNFEIIPASGYSPNLRQVFCSTNPYPNASTGSGPQFETKTASVTANTGTASFTGLKSKTKYFIRVGARASASSVMNYSDQIVVTTP